MAKIRNEVGIEYENYLRKVMNEEQELSIPEYQVQKWFNLSEIADIERQNIPEFFNGSKKSKTPELYQKYRNYMILLYKQSPRKYMNFTVIRRNLAGDVNGLIKIYKQLQKWGLINYSSNPIYNYKNTEESAKIEVFARVGDRLNAN